MCCIIRTVELLWINVAYLVALAVPQTGSSSQSRFRALPPGSSLRPDCMILEDTDIPLAAPDGERIGRCSAKDEDGKSDYVTAFYWQAAIVEYLNDPPGFDDL